MLAEKLVQRMLNGDRYALAKLMTLVENRHADSVNILRMVQHRVGRAYTIGITGPPGAGKSTLVDRTIGILRQRGLSVGIVAVDPSSPFSGGAVLGDRIRMQSHFVDAAVFIRSLSTRGAHGGLARATRNVAQLLDAFGKDCILIETVGVGQTELDVMRVADTTVVVLVPEAGDTIQTMKAGLLEVADVFVVNKADREGSLRIKTELETMLQLRGASAWTVPVLLTEATSGRGVPELVDTVFRHRDFRHRSQATGPSAAARQEEFLAVVRDEIGRRVETGLDDGTFHPLLQRVRRGEVDPYSAALELIGDEASLRKLLRGGGGGKTDG
ncbi:methylmalonyl Co-A mutase-associated GTPase MeaB [Candidatus Binatia bacterium]|nr:methylmalonyl Co-A mutase-associated GTPase MeaB [Candidatus Binatia bacterium]